MAESQMVVVQKAMSEQELRLQLARDLKALKQNPPDRAKVRGGRYVLADGRVVDANGKEIEEAKAASEADAGDESGDEGEESGDSTAPKTSGARKGAAKKGGR